MAYRSNGMAGDPYGRAFIVYLSYQSNITPLPFSRSLFSLSSLTLSLYSFYSLLLFYYFTILYNTGIHRVCNGYYYTILLG